MKILFIAPIPFFHERGACIRSLNMIRSFSEMGHHVDVLTYPVGRDVKIKNVNIIRVKTGLKPPLKAKMTIKRLLTDYLLYKKCIDLACKRKYDILIGKTPIGRLIGRKVKSKTRASLIVDVVESTLGMVDLYARKNNFGGKYISKIIKVLLNPITIKFLKNMELKNYRSADVILANWDLVKEEVKKESGKECILLYDTIPEVLKKKRVDPGMKKKLGIKNEKVLLYTGASTPQQGIDVYINSFDFLKHRDVKLVIVGQKNNKYIEIAKERGLSEKIIFTGEVKIEELGKYFETADILLTAYNSGGKNATIKLLFYLFQEKPIIASNTPQYTQVVDNQTVFLADPEPKSFAKAIDFVLGHPSLARKKAKKSLEYANKKFSKDIYLENMKMTIRLAKRS